MNRKELEAFAKEAAKTLKRGYKLFCVTASKYNHLIVHQRLGKL